MIVITIRTSITPVANTFATSQLVAQYSGVMNLARGPSPADVLGRCDLGGHRLIRIGAPQIARLPLHGPARIELPDQREPSGDRRRLLPGDATHGVDQRRIRDVFEHTYVLLICLSGLSV
jgi:hypothetical protein